MIKISNVSKQSGTSINISSSGNVKVDLSVPTQLDGKLDGVSIYGIVRDAGQQASEKYNLNLKQVKELTQASYAEIDRFDTIFGELSEEYQKELDELSAHFGNLVKATCLELLHKLHQRIDEEKAAITASLEKKAREIHESED